MLTHETLSPPKGSDAPRRFNRIAIVLTHTARYNFGGATKLARDVRVHPSTISRILSGRSIPTAPVAARITEALSIALNRPLCVEDVFSTDGAFAQPSGCRLCGCPGGCLPEWAYEPDGSRKPEFAWMLPGDWTLSPRRNKPPLTSAE